MAPQDIIPIAGDRSPMYSVDASTVTSSPVWHLAVKFQSCILATTAGASGLSKLCTISQERPKFD